MSQPVFVYNDQARELRNGDILIEDFGEIETPDHRKYTTWAIWEYRNEEGKGYYYRQSGEVMERSVNMSKSLFLYPDKLPKGFIERFRAGLLSFIYVENYNWNIYNLIEDADRNGYLPPLVGLYS